MKTLALFFTTLILATTASAKVSFDCADRSSGKKASFSIYPYKEDYSGGKEFWISYKLASGFEGSMDGNVRGVKTKYLLFTEDGMNAISLPQNAYFTARVGKSANIKTYFPGHENMNCTTTVVDDSIDN